MTSNIGTKHIENERTRLPLHGWLGFGLIVIFWTLNWTSQGPRTYWGFFPMWLGYYLVMDGLVFWRTSTSLLTRSLHKYVGLFLVSVPIWWIFELFNIRTQNWTYIGAELFTPFEYAFWTTLSFTTVIPAVFASAEFFASFDFVARLKRGPVMGTDQRTTLTFFVLGWLMLALMLVWPRVFSLLSGFPSISFWNRSTFGREIAPSPIGLKKGTGDLSFHFGLAFC